MKSKLPFLSKWIKLPPANSPEYKTPFVLVLGLLFFSLGCWMTLTVPYRIHLKSRLDAGLITEARILEVKMHGRGSISVRYQFSWQNKVMTGNRASIFSESDGLYHRLLNAMEKGEPVPCFMDPHKPELNALEKQIRWIDVIATPIMGMIFAVIGAIYLKNFRGAHIKSKKRQVSKSTQSRM